MREILPRTLLLDDHCPLLSSAGSSRFVSRAVGRKPDISQRLPGRSRLLACTLLTTLILLVLSPDALAQQFSACSKVESRLVEVIEGEVCTGKTFVKDFGPDFLFKLIPISEGWVISVGMHGRDGDLARMTPPFHGPNPTGIMGWHFRNENNTGPNLGSLNVPGDTRGFIFSPEVVHGTRGTPQPTVPTIEEVNRVAEFGRGELNILDYGLADLNEGQVARMVYLRFRVCLSWPEEYTSR